MSKNDWNAGQYLKFADERTRAARDLLAQVPLARPRRVVDLGCGPGNSTALLAERYPRAEVIGVDSAPAMLSRARERLPACVFVAADIATWTPDAATDLVFSNAAFQWVPGHAAVLRRLLQGLPQGGVLAVQMPDNTREPALMLQSEVARSGPWADDPALRTAARADLPSPESYYDLLAPFCAHVDIWRSVYHHVMAGTDAVVEWFKGSSLQPFLAPLDQAGRAAFLAAYRDRIARAYAPRVDGKVLLRFPRLFIVAMR